MDIVTGFFQDKLKIFFFDGKIASNTSLSEIASNNEIDEEEKIVNSVRNPYYRMFYIFEGKATVKNGSFEAKISDKTMVFAPPNASLNVRFIPDEHKTKYFNISLFPRFLPQSVSNDDFLRAFHNLPDDKRIVNNDTVTNELFNNLEYLIIHSYEQFYVHSTVQAIISRLCVNYDLVKDFHPDSDSLYVKIMKYIEHNYSNIRSIKEIEDKFFISSNTLEKIVKIYVNMNVWEYITSLRVDQANRLIETGKYSVSKCGELAGFDSYTSFYRNYKKYFGISPSEKQKRTNTKWPLD